MNSILTSSVAIASSTNEMAGMTETNQPLFRKLQLSNGMEVFDFDENEIINKMERMMQLLDEAL